MKVGDRVAHRDNPLRLGTLFERYDIGDVWAVKWDGTPGHQWHDTWFLLPVVQLTPVPAVCRCPIKDLTSVGHTDPQCPERKLK